MFPTNSTYNERMISTTSMCILAGTSIIFCALVVVTTFLCGLHKKPVNLLVANVASADLLLNVINLFLQPPNILSDNKDILCNWTGWLTYVCGLQANWGVPLLAINRYVAIYKGETYKMWFSNRRIILMIICSWAILIVITLPFHVAGLTGYENSYENCGVNDQGKLKWKLIILFFLVIPTFSGNLITAYCNFKIFLKFREHAKNAKMIEMNVAARNKELMYFTLLHVAFACFLQGPYILGKIVNTIVEGNILRLVFPILYIMNSTLSALSTLCIIRPYRDAARKMLKCEKISRVEAAVTIDLAALNTPRRRSTVPDIIVTDHSVIVLTNIQGGQGGNMQSVHGRERLITVAAMN